VTVPAVALIDFVVVAIGIAVIVVVVEVAGGIPAVLLAEAVSVGKTDVVVVALIVGIAALVLVLLVVVPVAAEVAVEVLVYVDVVVAVAVTEALVRLVNMVVVEGAIVVDSEVFGLPCCCFFSALLLLLTRTFFGCFVLLQASSFSLPFSSLAFAGLFVGAV